VQKAAERFLMMVNNCQRFVNINTITDAFSPSLENAILVAAVAAAF